MVGLDDDVFSFPVESETIEKKKNSSDSATPADGSQKRSQQFRGRQPNRPSEEADAAQGRKEDEDDMEILEGQGISGLENEGRQRLFVIPEVVVNCWVDVGQIGQEEKTDHKHNGEHQHFVDQRLFIVHVHENQHHE